MADIALKAKYSSEDVKKNSFSFNMSWSGSEYAMWQGKLADIEEHLHKTEDSTIIGIINEHKKYIESRATDAKEKEYQREVRGI